MSTPTSTNPAPVISIPNVAQAAIANATPSMAPGFAQSTLTPPGTTLSTGSTAQLLLTPLSTDPSKIDPEKSHRLEDDQRARKRPIKGPLTFSDTGSLVKFLVKEGDWPETFYLTVHKQVACHRSPVLRAAFNGPYLKAQEQTYYLEDAR